MPARYPVLLVKTHAFGDALLCTPAVRELIRVQDNEYWVLTGNSAAPVWERFPGIKKVFVAPIPPSGIADYMELSRWSLRNRKHLRIVKESIVFQGSPTVRRWVRYLTGSQMRSSGGDSLGEWESVFPMPETEYAGHSYSKTAGVSPDDFRAVFPLREAEREWVQKLRLPEPLFAVSPGGGKNPRDTVLEKRWFPDRFAEIIDRLSGAGFNIVLLGGEGDVLIARETSELCGNTVIDMTGKTTWGQTAAIFDRCSGFLGVDSGAAHLAAARSVPSVVLFGPSSPEYLFAPGLISPVRASIDCSPCYSNSLFPGCIYDTPVCMNTIDVEDVWITLQKVINENYNG